MPVQKQLECAVPPQDQIGRSSSQSGSQTLFGEGARGRSTQASLRITRAEWRKRADTMMATSGSGQAVLVQATNPAATRTAMFPIASLRLNRHTARTLASPVRWARARSRMRHSLRTPPYQTIPSSLVRALAGRAFCKLSQKPHRCRAPQEIILARRRSAHATTGSSEGQPDRGV